MTPADGIWKSETSSTSCQRIPVFEGIFFFFFSSSIFRARLLGLSGDTCPAVVVDTPSAAAADKLAVASQDTF